MEQLADGIMKSLMNLQYKPKDEVLFLYGLKILLRYIIFGFFISGLVLFFGNIKYIIFYNLILTLLRIHCGGYHANNQIKCFLLSVLSLVVFPELLLNIGLNISVGNIIMFFCTFFMIINKPILVKEVNNTFLRNVNIRKNILILFFLVLFLLQRSISISFSNMIALAFLYNVFSMLL